MCVVVWCNGYVIVIVDMWCWFVYWFVVCLYVDMYGYDIVLVVGMYCIGVDELYGVVM